MSYRKLVDYTYLYRLTVLLMCHCCCQIHHFLLPLDVRLAIFCPRGRVLTTHQGRVLVDINWQQGEFTYLLYLLERLRADNSCYPEAQELWLSKLRQFAREQSKWKAFYVERKRQSQTKAKPKLAQANGQLAQANGQVAQANELSQKTEIAKTKTKTKTKAKAKASSREGQKSKASKGNNSTTR